MNILKYYGLLIIALLSFSIGWESCSKEQPKVQVLNHPILKGSQEADSSFIIPVTRDSVIVAKFIETDFFDSVIAHTYINPQLDESEKLVFAAKPQIQGLFVPLTRTDSSYKKIWGGYLPDSSRFAFALIVEVINRVNGNTCLNYFYLNNEWAVSIVLDNRYHPIEYAKNPNPVYQPSGGLDCWLDCMYIKQHECQQDWYCYISCILTPEACIMAWTLDCLLICHGINTDPGGGASQAK